MKPYKYHKVIITFVLLCTTANIWAEKSRGFGFFFQGIFSDQVTLNSVKTIFEDFTLSINQPVRFYGGPTIDDIKLAVSNKPFDLLIWGYSDEINQFMQENGYQHLVSSPLQINMYQFNNTGMIKESDQRIGTLKNSTALYSAKHYYSEIKKDVNILTYDDYFLIVEACFRKDVNTIISAKPFISLQPKSIKSKFTFIKTLPDHAKLSIWVPVSMKESQKNSIVKYFIDHQESFSAIFGSDKFHRVL